MLRFEEKSFCSSLLGFNPYWVYKPTNPGEYISRKLTNLCTIYPTHLQYDCFDESIVNGLRQQKLLSFVLDEPPGQNVFCGPETIVFNE